MNYEDTRVFGIAVSDMQMAIETINSTEFAFLLRQIVPVDGGFWLIWKADSGLKARLEKLGFNVHW